MILHFSSVKDTWLIKYDGKVIYMHYIFVLADGWGYTYGGINVFNKLMCESMARQKADWMEVVCVAPSIEQLDIKKAQSLNLALLSVTTEEFRSAKGIITKIIDRFGLTDKDEIDWIGHDTYTGELALKCRDEWKGSRCAVIHHMAYGKYYPLLNRDTNESETKERLQKLVLCNCEHVFANGPVLTRNAQDIIGNKESVITILPGIVDVKDARRYINNDFSVVTFGRIETEKGSKRNNTIIKQIYLAVAAWADFSKTHLKSTDDTIMKVYGKNEGNKVDKELDEIFDRYGKSIYALSAIEYEKNRDTLLGDLASFSVCMVLSLREGFGLTAIEAVSAGVPLIVSKKSGFYVMLKDKHLESYVHGVDIQGKKDEPYFTDDDLKNVKQALIDIYLDQDKAKKDIFSLKEQLLNNGVTWDACAKTVLKRLDICYDGEDEEDYYSRLCPFKETLGMFLNIKPTLVEKTNISSIGVKYLGEDVDLSVRQGAVEEGDIAECLEYIKLVVYNNKSLPFGHLFKARWMFLEKINPSHEVGIEYLYHRDEKPLFTVGQIKEIFHDEDELWPGIINFTRVRITCVNMQSDYFFANAPEYNTWDGYI